MKLYDQITSAEIFFKIKPYEKIRPRLSKKYSLTILCARTDGENVYITQKGKNASDYLTVFGIHNCQLSSRISSDDALEETTAGETHSKNIKIARNSRTFGILRGWL